MAEYRTVRSEFWADPYIEELDAKAKLLYLYLFTNSHVNNLGICEISRKKIAFESGLSVGDVDKYLADFQQTRKLVFDDETNSIFLCNFIRHQTTASDSVIKHLKSLLPSITSPIIAEAVYILYPHLYGIETDGLDTVSIPYAHGVHTIPTPSGDIRYWVLGKGKGVRGKGKSPASGEPDAPPQFPSELVEFVQEFQEAVKSEHGNLAPEVTEKLVADGCDCVDKLIRLDNFAFDEIKSALQWAAQDEFWGVNVRSLARLRDTGKNGLKKFQNLYAAWEKSTGGAKSANRFAGAI